MVNDRFEFERFGTTFPFAIAQSLFTHLTLNTAFASHHHKRLEGTTLTAHLDAIERYRDTVADLL